MSVLHNLEAWWHAIWHHFVHGTLPPAPTVGGQPATLNPPAPVNTPPAPTLPPVAQQHVDQAKLNTPVNTLPPAPTPVPPQPAVPVDHQPPAPPAPIESVYLKNGDIIRNGITVADDVNGLVALDPIVYGNPNLAGKTFIDPASYNLNWCPQAKATIDENASSARLADTTGLGIWFRVRRMVPSTDPIRPWAPEEPKSPTDDSDELPIGAWSIGFEFADPAAFDAHMRTWSPGTSNPPPGHMV